MIKFLRWLCGVRTAPIMRGPETVDAWDELRRMGYTVESYPADNGLRHYSFWCNGQLISDWSDPITFDEMYRMRRLWSIEQWELLQKAQE